MADRLARKSPPDMRHRKPGCGGAAVSACMVQDEFAELTIRKRKEHADSLTRTGPAVVDTRSIHARRPRPVQDSKRLKAFKGQPALDANSSPGTVSAPQSAQSVQSACPFHRLPIELIWRVLDELRDNDSARDNVHNIGSVRSTCKLFAFAGLPRLYDNKCIRLRRRSGGPLDLTGLETLCEKLNPGDIERLDLIHDPDAVTNHIGLAKTAHVPKAAMHAVLQEVRVFVLGHQPVKFRQEQDASPTSEKENSIVKVRDTAEEHPGYLQQVAAMLAAMGKLQSLTMSSVLHWDEIMSMPGSRRLATGAVQNLALIECAVNQQSLQRFLEANRGSLRRLTLARLWMQDRGEVRELLAMVRALPSLDEFVFVSRRPGLSRPPSWQGHREALREMFGRGSQELPCKAEFAWIKP